MQILKKLFGDHTKKKLKSLKPIVEKINALEQSYTQLSDTQLQEKTTEFKERLTKNETLDDILPEAFATVREAAKRTLGMRHFDVQLIGGIILHQGGIAEMRTGEGKTLTATLPVYLNALAGKGVHVVTVNDYLAKRDAVWMGQLYDFLGMRIGIIQNQRVSYVYDKTAQQAPEAELTELDAERDVEGSFKVEDSFLKKASRKETYLCDITYGTNNEYGFDYLRDNMVQSFDDMVMRRGSEMHFAIIDEVDSILIDEARTPLIISAPAQEAADQYYQFAKLVTRLTPEDYVLDEKMRTANLNEAGITKFEQWLGVENLYIEAGIKTVHHIEQALKAEVLFRRDKDYVVEADGEVVIIDEFTGRKMPGRRYSDGLHQAIEAKEGVEIQRESRTLATITFQNLFRMYSKISGMTGTAETEEEEFFKIYQLPVTVIPTNKPDARIDHPDRIYRTEQAKFKAIVEKIKECQAKGQPILIGTASVEKNEQLSNYLEKSGIAHHALNAKNHEQEGEIIAQAGRPGAVTLATNMAGRGVDIKLGGTPVNEAEQKQVIAAGGLFVLGTERHESRRIDNQLRGRAARQGDAGETQFFISTEDEMMRVFAGERLNAVMTRMNVPDDMPIEQKMITRMIESAQKKVEGHHFDVRKHVLQYDDVLNRHRDVIYRKRRAVLELAHGDATVAFPSDKPRNADEEETFATLKGMIVSMAEQEIEMIVSQHTNAESVDDWGLKEISENMQAIFNLEETDISQVADIAKTESKLDEVKARDAIVSYLVSVVQDKYAAIERQIKEELDNDQEYDKLLYSIEKGILLRTIDMEWVEHLVALRHLRTGIGLRGYGQRDPLIEYKKESFHMFNELLATIQHTIVKTFFRVKVTIQAMPEVAAPSVMATDTITMSGAQKETGKPMQSAAGNAAGSDDKVGRNDMCPCGSGKKYKKCHGK